MLHQVSIIQASVRHLNSGYAGVMWIWPTVETKAGSVFDLTKKVKHADERDDSQFIEAYACKKLSE